jgi:hypothetical protein
MSMLRLSYAADSTGNLDADQVRLYPDNWLEAARTRRQAGASEHSNVEQPYDPGLRLRLETARLEAFKETANLLSLARLHGTLGNTDLRDRYIDQALEQPHSAWDEYLLRDIQGRLDLLTDNQREAVLDSIKDDFAPPQRAPNAFICVDENAGASTTTRP